MPWLCQSCLLACPVPFYVFLVQQNRRHAAPPSDIFEMPSGSALPVKRQVVEALQLKQVQEPLGRAVRDFPLLGIPALHHGD